MGEAAKVYAEELQKLAYGHPLWWPEHTKGPGGRERGIEIGDVGYIDTDGAFHPLFNIAHEREHELNAGKTPPNFAPLVWEDESIETKTSFLQPGPQSNSSIKHHQTRAEIAGNDPVSGSGMEVSYRFECSDKQGAILMLWDDATKTDLRLQQKHLMKYMKAHHESWYQFATETRGIDCEREDIVVVRGFVKTSCWTVAALTDESALTREVTLNGQLGPLFNIGAGYASHRGRLSSIHQRSGPSMRMSSSTTRTHWQTPLSPICTNKCEIHSTTPAYETMPRDQCVFLNYYKIKRKFLFLEQIVAGAGPSTLPDPDGSREKGTLLARMSPTVDDVDIQAESVLVKPLNPLDVILDYILEYSEANVAIASYTDLENFELDTRWPTTFSEILRSSSPKILVDGEVGTLSASPAGVLPMLPQEILGIIAKCLVGDIAALKSCSLVCRAWYAACAPHLFRLLQPLRGSSDPQQCLQAFIPFITDSESTPYLCLWVHRLCFVGNEQSNSRAVFSARTLSGILANLPNIRILELACVDISNYASDASVEPKTLQLPQVELDTLSMDHVRFGDHFSSQLSSILGLFSSLRMLRILNPTAINTSSHKDPTPLRPGYLRVEELSLEAYPPTKVDIAVTVDQVLNTSLKTLYFGSLRSIKTRCHTIDELQALGKLIRNAYETLHDVVLDLCHIVPISDDYQDIAGILGLGVCDSLHKLCINVFPDLTGSPAPSQWQRASKLLIEVISTAPRSITSMTIPLRSHNVPDRNIICWEDLNRLEKGSGWERFRNLSELIFALTPNCECLQLGERYISSQLSDLESKGILKISSSQGLCTAQADEHLDSRRCNRGDCDLLHQSHNILNTLNNLAGRDHNFLEYGKQPLTSRLIIPQECFPTPSPRPYVQLPSINFTVGGVLGIRLVDALDPEFNGLDDGGFVPRLSENGKKITLRIQWPGYSPWSDVIHLYDHTYNDNPNTLRKVAQLVAQKIQAFRNDVSDQPYNKPAAIDGWMLEKYPLEKFVLLELRHVSRGSWQPVLACL